MRYNFSRSIGTAKSLEFCADRDTITPRIKRVDICKITGRCIGDIKSGNGVALEDILNDPTDKQALVGTIQLQNCISLYDRLAELKHAVEDITLGSASGKESECQYVTNPE